MKKIGSVALFAALLLSACQGSETPAEPGTPAAEPTVGEAPEDSGAATVPVVEKDFSVSPSSEEAAAGDVTFAVTNKGPATHEFVVVKTDLSAKKLPIGDDGSVEEDADGLEVVDEIEDLEAGSTEDLQVTLDPGAYVLICNLPGHYEQGMHAGFTVS